MKQIESVKGTRDFYPEIKYRQDFIFKVWEKVARRFGYEDFEGPMLEPADLWRLKSGAEIPDQMYVFKDKGNREVAIRPELTPTLARMVAAKQKTLPKPIKWFSIGRFWRYEQPQSGRLREFWQFNCDCLGCDAMKADAEVIAIAANIMLEFGFTDKDFFIRIGNRKLMQGLMKSAGVKDSQIQDISRLIDKKDKIGQNNFDLSLKDIGFSEKNIIDLNKALTVSLSDIDSKKLDESGKKGLEELGELMSLLKDYGLSRYIMFDPSIVRGFDYYTSTVFEVWDRSKEHRAVAGGGRYENLVSDFGGEKLSGVGFAFGDVVLELFLAKKKLIPEYRKDIDVLIVTFDDSCCKAALEAANILRKSKNVEVDLMGRKIKKQFEYADKNKIPLCVIIGPEEAKAGKVKLKDMKTSKEELLTIEELKKFK